MDTAGGGDGLPSPAVANPIARPDRASNPYFCAIADGDFTAVDLTVADYARMADLVAQYGSLPLGTTDASVVAVAERFNLTDIATLDRRHFTVVRPDHTDTFTLLP